jgi:hypothetical protein
MARSSWTVASSIFVRADRVGEKFPIPDHVRRILQPYTVDDPGSVAA